LTISAVDAHGKFIASSAVKPENALSLTALTAVPAIRIFRSNTIAAYSYTLYNAQTDKTRTGKFSPKENRRRRNSKSSPI